MNKNVGGGMLENQDLSPKIFLMSNWVLVHRMYARETSNSEETTRVTTIANAYFNNEPDSQALINDYSDDPCLSQEYQITTRSTMTIPAC